MKLKIIAVSGYTGLKLPPVEIDPNGYARIGHKKTPPSNDHSCHTRESKTLSVKINGIPHNLTNFAYIHSGYSSDAYKYKDESGNFFIVKFPKKSSVSSAQEDLRKISMLKTRISKPNLLSVPLFIRKEYTVEPFVEGKTLKTIINEINLESNTHLTICQLDAFAYSMAETLRYLHGKKGISHRDIHGDNILLQTNGLAHLIDVGNVETDPTKVIQYHQIYVPHFPFVYDIHKDTSVIANYNGFVHDSWAFGCTLLSSALGKDIFYGNPGSLMSSFKTERQSELNALLPENIVDLDDWRKGLGKYLSDFHMEDFQKLFKEFGLDYLQNYPHIAEFLVDLFSSAHKGSSPFQEETISELWKRSTWV